MFIENGSIVSRPIYSNKGAITIAMNKFINFKMLECGFQYTFDNTTTQDEFEAKMNELNMNTWKVFGDLVYFYRNHFLEEEKDESEAEEDDEEDAEDEDNENNDE